MRQGYLLLTYRKQEHHKNPTYISDEKHKNTKVEFKKITNFAPCI